MSRPMSPCLLAAASVLVGVCALDTSAEAQPPADTAPATESLRGPDVTDRPPPVGPGGSIMGDDARATPGEPRALPLRVFMQAVLSLNDSEPKPAAAERKRVKDPHEGHNHGPRNAEPERPAPPDVNTTPRAADPDLRLTQDQMRAIRDIAAEHQKKTQEHLAKHAEELERIEARPDERAPGDEAEIRRQQARIAELREGAPSPVGAQTMIFALLTEPQREHVNRALEELRDDRIEDRAKREAKDQIKRSEERPPPRKARLPVRLRPSGPN